MGAPGTTEGEWYFEKCGCGHKSCSQYYLGNQGSVGFSLADAQQIAASGALFDAALGACATIGDLQSALHDVLNLIDYMRCGDGSLPLSGPRKLANANDLLRGGRTDDLDAALAQARGEVSVHTLEGGL